MPTFFHGTDAELSVGQTLLPGDEVGRCNWPGMDNGWGVWITPDADLAGKYGTFVYEVEAVDPVDWCAENEWEPTPDNNEWVCTQAQIVAVVRSPPFAASEQEPSDG